MKQKPTERIEPKSLKEWKELLIKADNYWVHCTKSICKKTMEQLALEAKREERERIQKEIWKFFGERVTKWDNGYATKLGVIIQSFINQHLGEQK